MTDSTIMARAKQLMVAVDEFGPTHIVSGDGNLEDENLASVEAQLETDDERELIKLLKSMPLDDRYEVWETAWDFISRTDLGGYRYGHR